jgi:hypothetical protein
MLQNGCVALRVNVRACQGAWISVAKSIRSRAARRQRSQRGIAFRHVQTKGRSNAGADLDFDTTGGVYFFDLRLDGSVISGTTRSVQFVQTGGDNEDFMPMNSTGFATGLLGTHTFSFTGRKSAAGDENIIAQSSSLTVVCQKKVL